MSILLNTLKSIRTGQISASYASVMIAIDELGGDANVHDIAKMLDQSLPILRTNLSRMCSAGWCKKVDVNQYVPTDKWVKVKKTMCKDN